MMNNKEKIIEKINYYRTFKENWNGYNAHPFDKSFLDNMIKFFSRTKDDMVEGAEIFPLPSGGIQIEYEDGNKEDGWTTSLEIEINPDDVPKNGCLYIEYKKEKDGIVYRNEKEFNIKNDFAAIRRCINKYRSGGFLKGDG